MTSTVFLPSSQAICNREHVDPFSYQWHWASGEVSGGFTAVVRVKNEARNLPFVLPQLLRSVERVVLVDNGSTDGTAEVAAGLAVGVPGATLEMVEYPFDVARCGSEHRGTPPDSVHSLTYFYNWAFSHVRTAYALKWDGDMVLTAEGERVLRELAWRLEGSERVVTIPRHSVYVRSATEAWVDVTYTNQEPWAWPNLPGYRFGKGMEWEVQLTPGKVSMLPLPRLLCFEAKWLDEDEFDHWSAKSEFAGSVRQTRKRREWDVFSRLLEGDVPSTLVRVTSSGRPHVLDIIRAGPGAWLEEASGAVLARAER